MIGEPGGMSTPVPSPDKSRNNMEHQDARTKKISRFVVKEVSEDRETNMINSETTQTYPQDITTINDNNEVLLHRKEKNRSRSMSIDAWRTGEEEHYDSSPSPVSCYDTASESGPYGNEILSGLDEGFARRGMLPDGYIRSVDSSTGYPDLAPITNGYMTYSSSGGGELGVSYPGMYETGGIYTPLQHPGTTLYILIES